MLSLLFTLAVIGLVLWGVDQLPIDGTLKQVIHVVAIVVAVYYVLQVLFGNLPPVHTPLLR